MEVVFVLLVSFTKMAVSVDGVKRPVTKYQVDAEMATDEAIVPTRVAPSFDTEKLGLSVDR